MRISIRPAITKFLVLQQVISSQYISSLKGRVLIPHNQRRLQIFHETTVELIIEGLTSPVLIIISAKIFFK